MAGEGRDVPTRSARQRHGEGNHARGEAGRSRATAGDLRMGARFGRQRIARSAGAPDHPRSQSDKDSPTMAEGRSRLWGCPPEDSETTTAQITNRGVPPDQSGARGGIERLRRPYEAGESSITSPVGARLSRGLRASSYCRRARRSNATRFFAGRYCDTSGHRLNHSPA